MIFLNLELRWLIRYETSQLAKLVDVAPPPPPRRYFSRLLRWTIELAGQLKIFGRKNRTHNLFLAYLDPDLERFESFQSFIG